jgi:hypothetical protein
MLKLSQVMVAILNFRSGPPNDHSCSHNSIGLVVSDKKIFKVSTNRNTLLALAAMLNFRSTPKTKSGRGPSNEHLWQVWLKSVQQFQRRRVKCEKLTDGRTLTHDKLTWPMAR